MDVRSQEPSLPEGRGGISDALVESLRGGGPPPDGRAVARADPFGEDLQLALYLCYELHYRGFAGVPDDREWDPELLRFRAALERPFLAALRDAAPRHARADEALDELLVEPAHPTDGTGVSRFLAEEGELWQLREYAAQRSLYHLKEADPHAWVLPRLWGRAKAGMAAVEFDEFGGGRADRVHARLFADLMTDLGLDPAYGRYVDVACAQTLALVNLMSLLGLHRSQRGALVGHFAAVEITSSPASRRLAKAMRRTGAGAAAEHFYTEHVEADAVHEQVVRHEVVAGLLVEEPHLDADVAFGVDATNHLEDALADRFLDAWRGGRSSLRAPG
ncbi:iron-containing redox enzyme family protein [Streptomyces heilongjiangensis]|uniref:Iron-containing redox enzyme family protein n=1 Tax=Streptomyces heilongjiangensis TaxID=945052 RepID=A0ABW1B5G2_9ACTN|nr:iron-containing redox enzyme family protein [Streptomyces heilongjiangensis]MDC2947131.1 iron-containing redox enzyme family protein [Streptomyces heilongjiangensis]